MQPQNDVALPIIIRRVCLWIFYYPSFRKAVSTDLPVNNNEDGEMALHEKAVEKF